MAWKRNEREKERRKAAGIAKNLEIEFNKVTNRTEEFINKRISRREMAEQLHLKLFLDQAGGLHLENLVKLMLITSPLFLKLCQWVVYGLHTGICSEVAAYYSLVCMKDYYHGIDPVHLQADPSGKHVSLGAFLCFTIILLIAFAKQTMLNLQHEMSDLSIRGILCSTECCRLNVMAFFSLGFGWLLSLNAILMPCDWLPRWTASLPYTDSTIFMVCMMFGTMSNRLAILQHVMWVGSCYHKLLTAEQVHRSSSARDFKSNFFFCVVTEIVIFCIYFICNNYSGALMVCTCIELTALILPMIITGWKDEHHLVYCVTKNQI